jgi:hypothetical protein
VTRLPGPHDREPEEQDPNSGYVPPEMDPHPSHDSSHPDADQGVHSDADYGVQTQYTPGIFRGLPGSDTPPEAQSVASDVGLGLPAGDSSPRPGDPGGKSGPGGSETDGYDQLTAAREDLQQLVTSLNEVSVRLANLTDTLTQQAEAGDARPEVKEQLDLAKQIAPEVSQVQNTAKEIYKRGPDQEPGLALAAAAEMSAAASDSKRARKRFPNKVWQEIMDLLESAFPKLWSLISHLVKVKEWSVTGKVGTGPLGMLEASISVTFGK